MIMFHLLKITFLCIYHGSAMQWYVKSKHASYPVGKATNLHIII